MIALILFHYCFKKVETKKDKDLILPRYEESQPDFPEITFSDITKEAGIEFVHFNGATGEKLLPETMGGGCAFIDYDTDGDQDILFINSTRWPGSEGDGTEHPILALYCNDGKGNFKDVTVETGLDIAIYGMGVAAGDYDNDGDQDIFITACGENRLFNNRNGVFVDVTEKAGVSGCQEAWGSGCSFFDFDNDNDLDLVVCNYVKWSRAIDLKAGFKLTGIDRAYGPPTNFEGSQPYLYENRGGGVFEEISKQAGLHVTNEATGVPAGKALAVLAFDYDCNGWTDLFIANDTVPNLLFYNMGDGRFKEAGTESGVAFSAAGLATGAMGVDAAYYRNDSSLGIVVGNFANEMSSLYVSEDSSGLFTDEAISEGVGPASRLRLTFGTFFFDYDLDGRLDLLMANGHIEEDINIVQSSQKYQQQCQLFWNNGDASARCFVPVPSGTTGDLKIPLVARAAAYADIDRDGDLDILLTQTGERPYLFRNEQKEGNHWLRIKLVGKKCNRDALGALVELKSGNTIQRRRITGTASYLSNMELPLTFGLGESQHVDLIRIIWPGGKIQEEKTGKIDAEITIYEKN